MDKKILIIIPAYNEQECIGSTIAKLREDFPAGDYIVINDCSTDGTLEKLNSINANYIHLSSNLGIGGAVQTGYKYAIANGYDIAIQLDGDGQHDSKYLNNLVEPIINGEADIVIGSRFIQRQGFQSTGFRRLGIKVLNFFIRLSTGFNITDCTSGFRAVNKEYFQLYAQEYPVDYPEPEAVTVALIKGARVKEIPVVMKERAAGTSSIKPLHSFYYMIKVTLAIIITRLGSEK